MVKACWLAACMAMVFRMTCKFIDMLAQLQDYVMLLQGKLNNHCFWDMRSNSCAK